MQRERSMKVNHRLPRPATTVCRDVALRCQLPAAPLRLRCIDIPLLEVQSVIGIKVPMRITFAVFAATSLFSTLLHADPGVIIRERAKELRDQNNVRQGVAAPTQPNQPAAAASASAPAAPTLSSGLLRFNTEINAIKTDSTVTPDQQQKLAQDLVAGAQGPKPSLATASRLAADVSAAFTEKPLSPTSRARFVQELDAVFNPIKYPMAKLDGILKDIQAIFQENGLARSKALVIANDVKAISDEIQKGGG